MPVTERFTWLFVQDDTRETTITQEGKDLTMVRVTSRRETDSNQTEEDVLLTVGYFYFVRLN